MSKIIQIRPIEKFFSITWHPSSRCNYDCMYCPPSAHNATDPHRTLQELKTHWLNIVEQTSAMQLKYKISFSGGEVTGSRSFIPFLKWLRSNYDEQIAQILITTNGSATYKYYSNLLDLVDNISFSLHSEHVNEQKFFDTIIKLKMQLPEHKHIHVNIMNEWWNEDRIPMYCDILKSYNISHNVNQINYSWQTRTIPIMKGKLNLANT